MGWGEVGCGGGGCPPPRPRGWRGPAARRGGAERRQRRCHETLTLRGEKRRRGEGWRWGGWGDTGTDRKGVTEGLRPVPVGAEGGRRRDGSSPRPRRTAGAAALVSSGRCRPPAAAERGAGGKRKLPAAPPGGAQSPRGRLRGWARKGSDTPPPRRPLPRPTPPPLTPPPSAPAVTCKSPPRSGARGGSAELRGRHRAGGIPCPAGAGSWAAARGPALGPRVLIIPPPPPFPPSLSWHRFGEARSRATGGTGRPAGPRG